MYRIALVSLLALPTLALAQPATHQVKLNGHTFTLPEGFTIEVAAGANMVPRPIAAAFDEKGRLYVTDSSGSNEKVTEQVKTKPHRILRLESTKGDGTFDKQTVFVKNVMFPEGAMWLNGSLYVAAPPHIWKFTDTNDDGVADKEEIWFDGKTLTGCANDLHGPYRGPDGHVYWTKGAFAKQEYSVIVPFYSAAWSQASKDHKRTITSRAAHIFREGMRDGTVEPLMTGGMDNPVDLVFTPTGDIIFSTTFFQHPGGGKRDGLVHAIYGAVYGKDHDPVYDHPWTSPALMPPMTHMGPAAPSGLHRYESDQFGKEYENNIFCCQFNMRKVSRHVLVPKGSTYETKNSDFVVSDNIDFHPTDVIEDADGSLLIVDTGGWYKLCCPTSQLVKPDVTGAIYRVKKTGAHALDDPRGEKIAWAKLDAAGVAKLLDDPRPWVQRATIEFAGAKDPDVFDACDVVVSALAAGVSERGVRNAIWLAAAARHAEGVMPVVRSLTLDPRPGVRQTALQVIRWRLDADGSWHAIKRLKDESPAVRRVAAEVVGRIGNGEALANIRAALADETNDRELDHALTFALIGIARAERTAEWLADPSPRVRRAALAALESMPGARLEPKAVFAELDAKDAALRETAWWIAGRHPQWGEQLAGYFQEKLKSVDGLKQAEREVLASRLVKFAPNKAVQKVLGDALDSGSTAVCRFVLETMARSGLKTMPGAWKLGLASMTGAKDEELARLAYAVLRIAQPTEQDYIDILAVSELHLKSHDRKRSGREWLALLSAAPPGTAKATPEDLARALAALGRDAVPTDRAVAAEALARVILTPDQLTAVAAGLKATSPLELPRIVQLFAKSKDERVGLAFVAALRDPAVRPAVRAEMVKPILDQYPKAVKDAAEKLYAELAEARKGETARLEKLLTDMKPGDVRRGQLVFNSAKTSCTACHKVGYVGGTAGPDLTRVGGIRTERDLLESVIFPSASFVRSYEPVRIVTKDDRVLNGVLKKDAPDEIIVVVAADKEERVARADVESIVPSTVSLMPAGMEQQLTAQELADLIAFLKACR